MVETAREERAFRDAEAIEHDVTNAASAEGEAENARERMRKGTHGAVAPRLDEGKPTFYGWRPWFGNGSRIAGHSVCLRDFARYSCE